jgi:uroporphyrin-III C-methyltransferase / precorrin-2 dehydrogenase / sirohydrochlorin ferrochelatase
MPPVPPQQTRPARMSALEVLPVFLNLAGRRAVVAGTGDALVWKAELLAAAGAHVEVFADATCDELAALAASPTAGMLALAGRLWRPEDLAGAAIAVGALEGSAAEQFAEAARAHGVPVNIVDTPAASTFSFGSIVNRSPVVIGISTAGAAPVLGQSIRAKIEALLHPAIGAWAASAQRLRTRLNSRLAMGPARREAWRRFADAALAARREPRQQELSEIVASTPAKFGSVALVGAGPGDPELLTLKALRAMQSADVILYDRLVSAEILELARREARRMLVGKAGNRPSCRQDDINALMVKLAREGRRVVRLKGGDPMLFARGAEEIEACRAAGIAVEVVPGITAALGAAAELQMPLTDRRVARRLQFVTGHSGLDQLPDYDWAGLADAGATTVLYMGRSTFADMLPRLLAAGLDPQTPSVAIVSATTRRRAEVRGPVRDLPAALAALDSTGPCLIMIGAVVAAASIRAGQATPLLERLHR